MYCMLPAFVYVFLSLMFVLFMLHRVGLFFIAGILYVLVTRWAYYIKNGLRYLMVLSVAIQREH
jgi:hypothetical protein